MTSPSPTLLRLTGRRRHEQGFSLIELMVVLLIIAILLGVAIPTYLAARDRAENRAAEMTLHNASTVAFTVLTGNGDQPVSYATLDREDPPLTFGPSSTSPNEITEWDQNWGGTIGQSIILGVRSASGFCFYQDTAWTSETWYGITNHRYTTCPWNEGPGPSKYNATWSPHRWPAEP